MPNCTRLCSVQIVEGRNHLIDPSSIVALDQNGCKQLNHTAISARRRNSGSAMKVAQNTDTLATYSALRSPAMTLLS